MIYDRKNLTSGRRETLAAIMTTFSSALWVWLKGTQGIRGGVNGLNKAEIADGVADTVIYGLQLLSILGLDAEEEIAAVIAQVLARDWKADPAGASAGKPVNGGRFA